MAEILLSLTIIGVVAVITLPSLTGNINERTWNTQRKALYARMSQAIALMPALNGYGTLTKANGSTSAVDTAAETFITEGLSKVLKINNICDSEHLADCGIVTSYTNMLGSQKTIPLTLYSLHKAFSLTSAAGCSYKTEDTKAAAFETQNGESIVAYYNRGCRTEYLNQESLTPGGNVFGFTVSNACLNFIYDLNGNKGPNTVGKDIGVITVFNATDSVVVAPMPLSSKQADATGIEWAAGARTCTSLDSEARMPNIQELSSMLINRDLVGLSAPYHYWSSTRYDSEKAWGLNPDNGFRSTGGIGDKNRVRCIRR